MVRVGLSGRPHSGHRCRVERLESADVGAKESGERASGQHPQTTVSAGQPEALWLIKAHRACGGRREEMGAREWVGGGTKRLGAGMSTGRHAAQYRVGNGVEGRWTSSG